MFIWTFPTKTNNFIQMIISILYFPFHLRKLYMKWRDFDYMKRQDYNEQNVSSKNPLDIVLFIKVMKLKVEPLR